MFGKYIRLVPFMLLEIGTALGIFLAFAEQNWTWKRIKMAQFSPWNHHQDNSRSQRHHEKGGRREISQRKEEEFFSTADLCVERQGARWLSGGVHGEIFSFPAYQVSEGFWAKKWHNNLRFFLLVTFGMPGHFFFSGHTAPQQTPGTAISLTAFSYIVGCTTKGYYPLNTP